MLCIINSIELSSDSCNDSVIEKKNIKGLI